jgi:membrane-associated protease RseP (regulator of RpoE activity)
LQSAEDGRSAAQAFANPTAGPGVLPLTYTQASAFPADVLADGRILFEAGFPLGTGTTPELYMVYADGSGVESYRCDHGKARWGLGLEDLTPDLRQQLQAPTEIHGALIENIQPGSSADDAGLARGDVILEVNRHSVRSAADVQQALQDVPKGHDALVLVWSSGGNSFRVLHSPEGAS